MNIDETLAMLRPEEYKKYQHNMSVYGQCFFMDGKAISPEEVYLKPEMNEVIEFEINKTN
jgi:hypothetical protein